MDEDLIEEWSSSSESSDLEEDSGSDNKSNTGNQRNWDPHVGMKPSCRYGHASDDKVNLEVEEELPYGANTKVNSAMLEFMWELSDDDLCNVNWLPPKMCKPETTGVISSTSELR